MTLEILEMAQAILSDKEAPQGGVEPHVEHPHEANHPLP